MIPRRDFLGWLGLTGAASAALGTVYFRDPSPSEGEAPAPPSPSEDLELRVYGGADYRDRRLLLVRRVPVRMERRRTTADWYGPLGLELVIEGPIVVTALACQVPRALRFLRDEVSMPSVSPVAVKNKGDTVTIVMPERLFSVS